MIQKSILAKTFPASCLAYTAMSLLLLCCSSSIAWADGDSALPESAPASTASKVMAGAAYSEDERALRDQAAEYSRLYAARDAKALANMWTADGTFTDSRGQEHIGRAAIETYFHDGFGPGAAQTLDVAVSSIKFPAPGVAIEEGTTRIASGPAMGSMGRYLVVHTKSGGKWLMQNAAETDCTAQSSAEYLKDLGWLIGSWSVKDKPNSAHLKVSWSKNKTFIVCRYVSPESKDGQMEELQIIGWDPESEHIVAWHFGAQGGFGCGKLFCDGKAWIERATATEPNGTTGKARYKITRLDNNNFTWQSSKRTISGIALPDSKELTITRDNIQ